MTDDWTAARAKASRLDAADPLAGLRDHFLMPEGVIYLDGNSLGAAPKAAMDTVETVARRVGFSSRSHFSRAFKRHFGVSPLSLRDLPS